MAVGRYYIVVTSTKKIVTGPIRLDSADAPSWPVNAGEAVITEAAMTAGGYSWPVVTPEAADVLRQKIPAAIAANNTFRNLASPTNAQVVNYLQNVVAKELNALLRLAGTILDDTSDS